MLGCCNGSSGGLRLKQQSLAPTPCAGVPPSSPCAPTDATAELWGKRMRSKEERIICMGHRTAWGALLTVLLTVMAAVPAECRAQAGTETAAPKTRPAVGTIKA